MKFYVSQPFSQWLKLGGSTIALMGILSGSMSALVATASTTQAASSSQTERMQQPATRKLASVRLPARIRTAVLRTYARQLNVPVSKLRVVSFSRESWSDSCLGLGTLVESCATASVNGWRVEVSDGSQQQFYRTDNTGRQIRIEDINNAGSLPQAVGQKVLAIAAKDSGIPVSQLTIAAAKPRTWDGCLGVSGPNEFCTMIGIPGWQVIVTGAQQYAVYHLNQTGTLVKRNPTTSVSGTVVPTFWEPEPSSPTDTEEIIFQSITSGGIAGQSYKTLLRKDGQVLRIDLQSNPPAVPTLIRQLSSQQVQEFIQTLQQNEFGDFLGFNYPSTIGADYFTIALIVPSRGQGVQYVDMIQDQTPAKLQQVIQAWNRITNPGSR